jgi:hypothetical protein
VPNAPQKTDGPANEESLPIGRTVLTALLLRRFGLLPLVALALAGRGATPARRRRVLTVAAGIYLGAALLLTLLVAALLGGLALVALTV